MNYLVLLKPHLSASEYGLIRTSFQDISPFYILSSLCYFYKSVNYVKVKRVVLFVSCLILSIKYLTDGKYLLKQFSELTDIPTGTLKDAEVEILKKLKYNLQATDSDFKKIKFLYNK